MVPSETVDGILAELHRELKDMTAAHGFAAMGLRRVSELFATLPRAPENPDPIVFIGIGDPNSPEARQYAQWSLSEALNQVRERGPVETRLGHQWIALLYSLWEHEYRPRLALAHGRDKDDEMYPLLGDLRRLRHDVLHHGGVATQEWTGRCEVVGHWFPAGDVIRLEGRHFEEFVRLFPWSDMAKGA